MQHEYIAAVCVRYKMQEQCLITGRMRAWRARWCCDHSLAICGAHRRHCSQTRARATFAGCLLGACWMLAGCLLGACWVLEGRGIARPELETLRMCCCGPSGLRCWTHQASQRSLHNAPIFRLLLKVAVKGTHQCDFLNFCRDLCPNK